VVKISQIQIQDLTYYYPGAARPSLAGINLNIGAGEFILVTGPSGCGKSTLIKILAGLLPGFNAGTYGGQVYLGEKELRQLDRRSLVKQVGMVFQDPESQLVMTGVEQELAFGMENLATPNHVMKSRMMEVCSLLGLSGQRQSPIDVLSGGQKQKVALASVLALQPDVLILDEPTSQLDPVASEDILTAVKRLNEENGLTVILVEQRLDRCFHLADRVLLMKDGRVVYDGIPGEAVRWAVTRRYPFIPLLAGLFAETGYPEAPLTVKQGRAIISKWLPPGGVHLKNLTDGSPGQAGCLVEVKNLWFTYPDGEEALKNVSLKVKAGEFVVIMGDNAAGKTTLLKNINGLLKPGRGSVRVGGRDTRKLRVEELAPVAGYLSQDPNDYLFMPTVREELAFTINSLGLEDNGLGKRMLERLGLAGHIDKNPRDLSTGERQRVALACILVARPRVLLLDEPTRGLDYNVKAELGQLLKELQNEGMAVVLVTHDVEFAAEYGSSIVLMDGGTVVTSGSKYDLLSGSSYYSPQISRLFNKWAPRVVTREQGRDILLLLRNNQLRETGEV
jgi:energy-coupling factor transport system ATP-binding protein